MVHLAERSGENQPAASNEAASPRCDALDRSLSIVTLFPIAVLVIRITFQEPKANTFQMMRSDLVSGGLDIFSRSGSALWVALILRRCHNIPKHVQGQGRQIGDN